MIERFNRWRHRRRWDRHGQLLAEGRVCRLHPHAPRGRYRGETPAQFAERLTFYHDAQDATASLRARKEAASGG